MKKDNCVLAKRLDGTKEFYALNDELPTTIHQLLDQIHDEMYAKALKFRDENIRTAKTYDEFKEILNTKAGYIRMMWCGDEACESQIKEETGLHLDVSKKTKKHLVMFVQFVVNQLKKLFTLQKHIKAFN